MPLERTAEQSRDLLEREQAMSQDLARIINLKDSAKPKRGEAELVIGGTLIPDRRLSNEDRVTEARINRLVRERFRIGALPKRRRSAD